LLLQHGMVERQGTARDREAGEDHEPDAVRCSLADEARDRTPRLFQAVAGKILGHHRGRDVERDDDVDTLGRDRSDLLPRLRPCQCGRDEHQHGAAQHGERSIETLPGRDSNAQPEPGGRQLQPRVRPRAPARHRPGGGKRPDAQDQRGRAREAQHQLAPAATTAGRGFVASTMR
jgi:hypothetical protein